MKVFEVPREQRAALKPLATGWEALIYVALAEKLGYHLDHEYTAYEVMCQDVRLLQ